MEAARTLNFASHRLWCLQGGDVPAARAALEAREVDGLYIAQGMGYALSDVACLVDFPSLAVLAIGDAPGVDISAVSHLTSLQFLSVGESAGTVRLEHLQQLTHLRLHLAKGRALPAAGLPALDTLAIWSYGGTDLSCLAAFPALTSLEITQARHLATLDGIQHCRHLRELDLAYCPALHDLGALVCAHGLRRLELMNVKRISNYTPVAALTALTRLAIDKAGPSPDLAFVAPLLQLESFVMRKTPVLDLDLSPLTRLPALSHVYLDSKKEYGKQVKDIEAAVALRKADRA